MPDPAAIAALSALGGSGLGAAVTAWVNRRKVSADATSIIADAAAKVVQTQTDTILDLKQRVEHLERQRSEDRKAQQLHVTWDHLARERLSEKGIDLPEPPPLYAPEVP